MTGLTDMENLAINSTPRVWVLTNDHPGNRTQAIGLAEALGWEYEIKELHFTPWSRRRRQLPFLPLTTGLDRKKSANLNPPWPDLVIGVGCSAAPITRWVGRVSGGRTRTVHLGRGGGPMARLYDAVITPLHCRMPPDARRYEVILPLNSISVGQGEEWHGEWNDLLQDVPRPVVALLVGGDAARFRLSGQDAEKMASRVRIWAEQAGGTVLAVTSRRTSSAATLALQSVLTGPHRVYDWQKVQRANPYRALLARADVLVVTGESESMLAEAATTAAPVYIYPIREIKTDRPVSRLREWAVRRAYTCFSKTGDPCDSADLLDAFFAWTMRHGLIRPRRDLNLLHAALFSSGRALPFGEPLRTEPQAPLQEVHQVAAWLKNILQAETDNTCRAARDQTSKDSFHAPQIFSTSGQ